MSAAIGAWNWRKPSSGGIWKHGPRWMRPMSASAPWVSLALAIALFALISGRYASSPGIVFDLPSGSATGGEAASMVAIVLPVPRDAAGGEETLVFFDDARYVPGDPTSLDAFKEALSARAGRDRRGTLLVMADKRITGGEMMRIVDIARESGVKHVQIAEKRP